MYLFTSAPISGNLGLSTIHFDLIWLVQWNTLIFFRPCPMKKPPRGSSKLTQILNIGNPIGLILQKEYMVYLVQRLTCPESWRNLYTESKRESGQSPLSQNSVTMSWRVLNDTLQTSHRWTDGYNRSGINYLGTSCGLFWGNWLYDHLVITLVPLWEHFGAIWWLLSDHWRSVLLPCRQHLWPFYYMCEFEKHISVSVPGKL